MTARMFEAGPGVKNQASANADAVLRRVSDSASGFVKCSRFVGAERAAAELLVQQGKLEAFKSALGPAWRVPKAKVAT